MSATDESVATGVTDAQATADDCGGGLDLKAAEATPLRVS